MTDLELDLQIAEVALSEADEALAITSAIDEIISEDPDLVYRKVTIF